METGTAGNAFYNDYRRFDVDPGIVYPCYKSFDPFIDVGELRSLDAFLTEQINKDIDAGAASYFVNVHRLEKASPYRPGVREIWLSRTKDGVPAAYSDLVGQVELWERNERASEFEPLTSFIDKLPFKETGRVLIIYDDESREVPAHRDHLVRETCNEFVWFRTNLNKPLYMLDSETREKKYVQSYSAWFDVVNQYHGCDAAEGLTFSIRVDGVFTDEFRRRIPVPEINPASTPAYWASLEGQH